MQRSTIVASPREQLSAQVPAAVRHDAQPRRPRARRNPRHGAPLWKVGPPPRPPPRSPLLCFLHSLLPARLRSAYAALSPEQINPKIKDMEYAVRGQLVINAMVRPRLPGSPPPAPAAALSQPEVQSQRARSPDARPACFRCRRTSRPWRTARRVRSPTSCCATSATRSPSDNSRSPSPAR